MGRYAMTASLALLLMLVFFLAGLGRATVHEIEVGNFFFSPTNTVVQPGDTVRWTLVSGTHTTTSEPSSPKNWDSGILSGSFDLVFEASDGPGPFPYLCSIHPTTMKDTIFMDLPGPDTVDAFGFQCVSLGQAALDLDAGNLVVSNIGSSGDDGVSIDLSGVTALSWDSHWLDIPSGLPTGAGIEVTAIGDDGIGNSEIGTGLAERNISGDWEISADFSAAGATTQTILVLNGGTIVASESGHTGIAAIAAGPPNDWHWEVEAGTKIMHGCTATWDIPVEITIPGITTGPVMGDEVEMIPEDNTTSHVDIEIVEMRLTSVDPITIDNLQTSDVLDCCDTPGDATNDGSVNVGDAVLVINFVFKGGPAPACQQEGDANGDNDLNVGDGVYIINFVFKGGPSPICGP